MLLSLKELYQDYNNRILLDNVEFNIDDNDKIGLIGVNGVGKSTLLKMIRDYPKISRNQAMAKPNLRISYLAQDSDEFETEDILEYVLMGSELDEYEAKRILNQLNITNHNQTISKLSGGQKKRIALAKVLASKVDLLLLDEPTNHLDVTMIEWLENYLSKIKTALVMISHDRYFLEGVVNKIIEIDGGQLYEYEGSYSDYLALKAQRIEDEKATFRKQVALLKNEHKWMMQGPKARSTKSKDRTERYEELKEKTKVIQSNDLVIDAKESRLGKKILEIEHLNIGYGNNVLIRDFSYTFKQQDRIGVVGINGSGKTSLLNVLTEEITPLSGKLNYGSTVKIGYFNQHSDDLNNSKRVIDYIKNKAEYIEMASGRVSASMLLEQFLFTKDQQYSLIERLSGGERRKLLLLGVLMKAPNFLILDEPTNDLDIITLTILEDYLMNFNGVLVIVSHDRYFMAKLVENLWLIKDQKIMLSLDDYTSYLVNNKQETNSKRLVKKEYVKEKKLRLNYQEQKDLENIDQEIAELTKQLGDINQEMNTIGQDYDKLRTIQIKQEEVSNNLEKKELRWLELQEKVELIENS